MLLPILLLNAVYAYTIKGVINGFEHQDVQTTSISLDNDLIYTTELISSSGNFVLRGLTDGDYRLRLQSTTLKDKGFYIINIDQGELSVKRVEENGLEYEANYPIEINADRRKNIHQRRKPRLHDIYTDKTVILAMLGLGALTILPKLIMNMEEEDLKLLELKGDGSAFEMAQKFANAHTKG